MPFQKADTTSGWEPGEAMARRADRLRCRATAKGSSARRAGARGNLTGRVAGVDADTLLDHDLSAVERAVVVVALGVLVDVSDGVVDAGPHLARGLVVAGVEGLLELLGGRARQGSLLELASLGLGSGEDAV